MTGDRPAILSARQRRHARIVADADRLKAMQQSERPGEASLDAVREAYADAMDALAGDYTSVAGVEAIDLPSDRLTTTT
jgi:hypothetical protein